MNKPSTDYVPNLPGVYAITHIPTGGMYIGKSHNMRRRVEEHLKARDDSYLHKKIREYGVEEFRVDIVRPVWNQAALSFFEELAIWKLGTCVEGVLEPKHFNVSRGGVSEDLSKSLGGCNHRVWWHIERLESGIEAADRGARAAVAVGIVDLKVASPEENSKLSPEQRLAKFNSILDYLENLEERCGYKLRTADNLLGQWIVDEPRREAKGLDFTFGEVRWALEEFYNLPRDEAEAKFKAR